MENAHKPINPCNKTDVHTGNEYRGLTKREYFAGLAMQGLCACPDLAVSRIELAIESIKQADELLKQLEQ
jgi:hypothetical protein